MAALNPDCTNIGCVCASCERVCFICNSASCVHTHKTLKASCDYYKKTTEQDYLDAIERAKLGG